MEGVVGPEQSVLLPSRKHSILQMKVSPKPTQGAESGGYLNPFVALLDQQLWFAES